VWNEKFSSLFHLEQVSLNRNAIIYIYIYIYMLYLPYTESLTAPHLKFFIIFFYFSLTDTTVIQILANTY